MATDTASKTTARIDHSDLGKSVVCKNCGFAIQVSKRYVVTHFSNGRRTCPTR